MSRDQPQRRLWRAIGLMSGTSLDGEVDVALIETDGASHVNPLAFQAVKMDAPLLALLEESLSAAAAWQFRGPEPAVFKAAESRLTDAQADAVLAMLAVWGESIESIDVVGFHGQTVLHRAPGDGQPGLSRQLGDGRRMAERLNISVVNDFRTADLAAGGQGAPLAPIYHAARLQALNESRVRSAVLNLGGVANLTLWTGQRVEAFTDAQLLALDTGPANAPLDDLVRAASTDRFDRDGERARRGRVDEAVVKRWMQQRWFDKPPPKSLDRNQFNYAWVDDMGLDDALATLCAFSAEAVARALRFAPAAPSRLLVAGGGRHHPVLMAELARRCAIAIEPVEAVGWNGDALEAECFAYLAVRSLLDLPLSFHGTTGVAAPQRGGVVHLGRFVME